MIEHSDCNDLLGTEQEKGEEKERLRGREGRPSF